MAKKQRKPNKNCKLTPKLLMQIRMCVMEGLPRKEIEEKLNIPVGTWSAWYFRNTHDFRAKFTEWEREYSFSKSQRIINEILNMPTEISKVIEEDSDEEDGGGIKEVVVTDPRLVKIRADMAVFVAETLGKEFYSKKQLVEDPGAATKEEMEEMRKKMKNMFNFVRQKNHSTPKTKLVEALK